MHKEIKIKEWKGQRVVTFKEIDLLHERVEGTAGRCFRENKKKFIENEDYYNLTPENIKMDEIRRFGITSPRGGYLITESGYLMLVKSFTVKLSKGLLKDIDFKSVKKGGKRFWKFKRKVD